MRTALLLLVLILCACEREQDQQVTKLHYIYEVSDAEFYVHYSADWKPTNRFVNGLIGSPAFKFDSTDIRMPLSENVTRYRMLRSRTLYFIEVEQYKLK